MTLLSWGFVRNLLSLAGVGLAFHLGRRQMQNLEKRVLELEDDKEELRGLHAEAVEKSEHTKEKLYVAEKQVQEYKNKLSLAEKKVEEYEDLYKKAFNDIKHLKAEKTELAFSLESALQNLRRREELMACSAHNKKLENSMVDVTAPDHLEIKGEELENLAAQNREMQREIALLHDEKIQNLRENEALNGIVEALGDENMRLQKEVKDLKAQLQDHVTTMQVPATAASPDNFSLASLNG